MTISSQLPSSLPITVQLQVQNPSTVSLPTQETVPDTLNLADKTEIHEAKIMAPLLWTLTGVVPYFINRQPEKIEATAQGRSDVLNKKRSLKSGIRLEKEKAETLFKAVLLPTLVGTLTNTFFLYHAYKVYTTKSDNNTWKSHLQKYFQQNGKKTLLVPLIPIPFVALTALAYKFFEKPESPDFNKQL